MSWTTLYRYTAPIDPDYGGAPMVIALLRDNLGGLILEMNVGDGEIVIAEPISDAVAQDLARALHPAPSAPVVEAAEALVEGWGERPRVERDGRWCSPQLDQRLDALARAVRAAREPRTGEQG